MSQRPMKTVGRFELDLAAGAGAMGTIYRAMDTATGRLVALKLLRGIGQTDAERFTREARSLGTLMHPAIVGYVDHGATTEGDAYLAMEWLDGEDLRARLARAGLTIHETLALGLRLAGALAEIHRRRLVHRDVKPANIFLPGGQVEACKLVDFGLARPEDASVELTRTGVIIGTPQYMSPEQARGDRVVDARSDVFSLGCVLFRCLTGRAPFEGTNVMAVLTRVLLDESPRARDLNPAVPAALDAIVLRMLAKKAADRHASGAELLLDLEAVAASVTREPEMESVASVRTPVGLSASEHRLAAMVLIGAAPVTPAAPASERTAETLVSGERAREPAASGARSRPVAAGARAETLASVVEQHRGQLETLLDGTCVVTIVESTIAVDQAADAARCALALRDALPHVPIGLVMGRSGSSSRGQLADAIDRVVEQLERSARALAEPFTTASIAIDEAIASLLGPRFIVTRDGGGASLAGESEAETRARTVLGKVTALVGREWEMSTLVALFRECEGEPVARPVLVTGPAGMGKSRLAGEIVPAIVRASPGVEVWAGRGLSLRAGSPLALLGSLLRSACGVRVAAPLEERRAAVLARVQRHVPAAHVQRVAEMIGELAGAPFPDEHSPPLRAARADSRLMGEQTRSAFRELLAAECAAHPLLVLLEDLHWGDVSSVRYVGDALRDLAAEPWMVLAFARPEVHERFPGLWSDRNVQEVRLKPLARRAAERLVRDVLGPTVAAADVARIVARADGNAYHLEELIRAFAKRGSDAGDDTLPPTVLAMAQARLDALDPDLRRMLRAASIFGDVFWLDGVTALLGGDTPASWGRQIEAQELVVRRPESRFAGQQELTFRHALLREGAYAMLPDADRALGHRLAGEWLERQGETDPLVLASHFSLGGEPGRASEYYLHAAERAGQALDLDSSIAHAEKALASAPSTEAKLLCQSLLGVIHALRYEWHAAWPYALAVTEHAAPGTVAWIRSTIVKRNAGIMLGNLEATAEATAALLSTDPVPEGLWAMAEALSSSVFGMNLMTQFEPAAATVFRLEKLVAPRAAEEPVARGHLELARAYQELWANGSPWAALAHARAACAAFDEANDTHGRLYSTNFVGNALHQLGDFEEADRVLRSVPDGDSLSFITMLRDDYLEWLWLASGRYEEGRAQVTRRLAQVESTPEPEPYLLWSLRWMLAELDRITGDLESAERTLTAIAPEVTHPHYRPAALASVAAARLALGRPSDALAPAREAVELVDAHGGHIRRAAAARLLHAEALHATGDPAAAKSALAAARDRLLAWAAHIPDPAARRRYLDRFPEHARTLSLAEEWGV